MRILVCAVVCALVGVAGASPAAAQGVEGGVKAGITSATLSITGLEGFESSANVGMLAGAWVSVGNKNLRLQPELIFTTRRLTLASPFGDIGVSSRTVDVPVLVVGRWRADARTRPLLFAGPSFAFISGVTQAMGSTETDISDQIKNVDAGIVIGGGAEIGVRRGAIVLDARFSLGLRDLSEASETTFKSRTVMASFGYRF